jgi:hypothetical protein
VCSIIAYAYADFDTNIADAYSYSDGYTDGVTYASSNTIPEGAPDAASPSDASLMG